jgi:hypothetical protein
MRTVDTADRLLNPAVHRKIKIEVEKGLLESLQALGCTDPGKLAYKKCVEMNDMKKYRNQMDCKYHQKYSKKEFHEEIGESALMVFFLWLTDVLRWISIKVPKKSGQT